MTEDELFFAVDAVRTELQKARQHLSQTAAWLEGQNKNIARNLEIEKSLIDALKHLFSSPVISLSEYRSLIKGLSTTKTNLHDIQEKRTQTLKIRNQAAIEAPKLGKQLVDLELQLERYEPPRVVLEFRKNDKQ